MAVGGMSFGTAGATGNLASGLMTYAMNEAIQKIGITETGAVNLLTTLAVTMAGAGVGGTAGAAAAFNADTNNRQLTAAERTRITQLAGDNMGLQVTLVAAGCYLVRCSGQFLPGTTAYQEARRWEAMGAPLVAEQNLLLQQYESGSQLFTYSWWNSQTDAGAQWAQRYALPLARLGGGVQVLGGGAGAVAGSSLAAAGLVSCPISYGAGCAAVAGGYALSLWSVDQFAAGVQTIINPSVPRHTLGAQLISEVTGLPLLTAELWYGSIGGLGAGVAPLAAALSQNASLAAAWSQAAMRSGFAEEVAVLRSALPYGPRTGGNMGIATIQVDGLPPKMVASSRISSPTADQTASGFVGLVPEVFPSSAVALPSGIALLRNIDAEAKILNNAATLLGNNTSATGTIILFTERVPCSSCANTIVQFQNRYPNISLIVIDNNGAIALPPRP